LGNIAQKLAIIAMRKEGAGPPQAFVSPCKT